MSKIKRGSMIMAAMLSSSLLISACSSTKGSEEKTSATPGSTATAAATATSNAAADPFGKYSPSIELTTVRAIDANYKFAAGESLDNNIWTPIMENELGIKVTNKWVVDGSQYEQKQNVTIASGDLPDFMVVNRVTMQHLIDSNLVEDLTAAFEKYASPDTKEMLKADGGSAMKSVTVNGKLMALPITNAGSGIVSSPVLWVRTDWLQKLNLPEPKTMEDVYKIATAFAKNDPDGNGKADTFGLGVNNDNETGQAFGTLHGLFNGYHAYPTFWVKDASGKLAYGGIQPEMKTALEKLQQLYKDGIIDKEFSVKPWKKLTEDVAAGKLGMAFGLYFEAITNLKESRTNNPKADWKAFPIVSADGNPALVEANESANGYYVVKKGTKNPEAVIKLLNLYLKKFYKTDYSSTKNPFLLDSATGIQPQKYFPVLIDYADVNIKAHLQVMDELNKKGDGSKLGSPASIHFGRITKFRQGDDSMWFSERTFGEGGSFAVFASYLKNKTFQNNEFIGAPTATMVEKNSTLEKMQKEMILKIIMGAAPVSDYDKFVSQWKSTGGDVITKEVNDYYNKNK